MLKKSKVLSYLLILGIIIGSFGNLAYASDNTALMKSEALKTASHWSIPEITWADTYGFIPESLYSNFKESITREELSSLSINLYEKITKKESTPAKENPFTDTKSVDVLKAYNLKIIEGLEESVFAPNNNATREEIAKTFYDTIKACEPELSLDTEHEIDFEDKNEISKGALDAITYMNAKNVLKGKSYRKVAPKDDCSREEAIVLLNRVYELILKETGKASKGLMWKVYDDDSEVYILGSIHLANSDIYPLSYNIEAAYNKADYIGVEANILDQSQVQSYLLQVAIYNDGSTIKDHISEETYNLLNDALVNLGLQPGQFDQIKPWYATLALANSKMTQGNQLQAAMGVDMYFLTRAYGQKEILEVEGIKFQFDMFDSLSPELQERQLTEVLKEEPEVKEENTEAENSNDNASVEAIKDILETWKNGNVEEFKKVFIDVKEDNIDELTAEYNNIFWTERDKHMADKVIEYLGDENDSTYFIIVGAGHLIGEDGVINLLDKQGYALEQVK